MKCAASIFILLLAAGCLAAQSHRMSDGKNPYGGDPGTTTRPATPPTVKTVDQTGQGNAAIQSDVGVKGIEYHSDLSWKAVTLMLGMMAGWVLDKLWSHNREMLRIKSRGR